MLSMTMSTIIRYGRFTAAAAGGIVPLSLMMMMMVTIGSWLPKSSFALNSDGFSLLALKAAVTHDPHQALAGWEEGDGNPCGWEGVSCSSTSGRVTELALPDKGLTGYIPSELGFLLALRRLALPHNNLSKPIPTRLLAIPALASLDLSHNSLTGPIPDKIRLLANLTFLDLSSNTLSGPLPPALAQLPSLAGTLNLSYNCFSGPIPTAFARFPPSLSLDLRHNNLSGPVPQIGSLLNQGPTAFAGNPYLCGFPLQAPCSHRDEGTTTTSPGGADNYNLSRAPTAATAAGGHPNPSSSTAEKLSSSNTFPKITILASGVALILAAAIVLVVLSVRCLLVRRRRRRADAVGGGEKQQKAAAAAAMVTMSTKTVVELDDDDDEAQGRRREAEEVVDDDYYHHHSSSSSSYADKITKNQINQNGGELRVLDEGFGVGLEELLRASAYVVGKSRSGIVYKVVVGKGVAMAVRRLSELGGVQGRSSGGSRSSDHPELEAEAEVIGRVRHPNLVRLRAYYFAPDERLLVSDYIPNGTLHSALHAGT